MTTEEKTAAYLREFAHFTPERQRHDIKLALAYLLWMLAQEEQPHQQEERRIDATAGELLQDVDL